MLIVTLEYDPKRRSRLRAVTDDGIHGKANCKFPAEIFGIDRTNVSNAGVQFKVRDAKWNTDKHYYEIPRNKVIGVVKPDDSVVIPETKAASEAADRAAARARKFASATRIPLDMFERLAENKRLLYKESHSKLTTNYLNEGLFEVVDELDQTLNMRGYPLFDGGKRAGKPKVETWLLIKIYEACIDPGTTYDRTFPYQSYAIGAEIKAEDGTPIGTKAISRDELVKRVGTACVVSGSSSTFFNYFKVLNLAYVKDNALIPGPKLKDWIEGKSTGIVTVDHPEATDKHRKDLDDYPNPGRYGFPLTGWVDKGDVDMRTPTAAHVAKDAGADDLFEFGEDDLMGAPLSAEEVAKLKKYLKAKGKDKTGVMDDTSSTMEEPMDDKLRRAAERRKSWEEATPIPLDMFEALNPDEDERDCRAYVNEYEANLDRYYKNTYCEYKKIPYETTLIEGQNFNEEDFDHMCNLYGWARERARKGILRR